MANSATYNRTKVHFSEGAAADTPDASEVVVYAKTDGLMYSKDDAGTETLMSSGSALSNPMTTAEDIIKASDGSGTPARMALGASNTALASSNSTLAYVKVGERTFAPDSLNASAAPSASNDFTQGWRRGSRWIDTTNDKEYVCLDEATGAAVWTETTQSGGGGTFVPLRERIIAIADESTASSGTWAGNKPTDTTAPYVGMFTNASAAANGDYIQWQARLATGTWKARIGIRQSTNTGILDLTIDGGSSEGTYDTYYSGGARFAIGEITDIVIGTYGTKEVRLTVNGKNASSSGYVVGIFGIDFVQTA